MASENIKLNLVRLDDPEFSKYEKIAMEEAKKIGAYTAKAWIKEGFNKGKVPGGVLPLLLEDNWGEFQYTVGVRPLPLNRRSGFLKDFTKEEIRAAVAEIGVSCGF